MWYDSSQILSKNCLFNFIIGGRGIGKTTHFQKRAVKRFLDTGEQFIYLRRYKTELKGNKLQRFFDTLIDINAFPDTKLSVKGNTFLVNDKVAGYAIPLSTSAIVKSDSFPNVGCILFDEFLIDKGAMHYLPDEVTLFLSFYDTVARHRENVLAFFLANAISFNNPYFNYFRISMPYGSNILKRGEIAFEMCDSTEYANMRKQTRFGKLIEGTEYGDYALDNKFLRDTNAFIEHKTGNSRHICTFIVSGKPIGLWCDSTAGKLYASYDVTENAYVYAASDADHNVNTMLLRSGQKPYHLRFLLEQYRLGNLRFESQRVKGEIMNLIREVGR